MEKNEAYNVVTCELVTHTNEAYIPSTGGVQTNNNEANKDLS